MRRLLQRIDWVAVVAWAIVFLSASATAGGAWLAYRATQRLERPAAPTNLRIIATPQK